jgi:hypothetical protein
MLSFLKLSIEELTASYEKEKEKLDEMMPDGPPERAVDPTTAALEMWASLQGKVETVVGDVVSEERSPDTNLIYDEDMAPQ